MAQAKMTWDRLWGWRMLRYEGFCWDNTEEKDL